ncbi:MAG: NAD-dependent epimerase/dehydratase family protein [Spirochaetes bacterium]|nr:NAD-dependent epimerase/dehydratase family protein [Spirochaetota bacterium]
MADTVLITGATGFIGGHLLAANLKKKRRVRALVLPDDPGAKRLADAGVEIVQGDIRNFDSVREAVRGVNIVFHCAAVVTDWAPKRLFWEITVGGTENICRAASEEGVKRLVDMSTNDVFGLNENVMMDETFPLKKWGEPYSDSKIDAEEISWRYHRERGLPVTMVYPCWVYGVGDLTFVPLLADAIVKRDLIFWRKDVIVWPTYIENLVDLLMLISEDPRAVGNGYLVHDGESVTLQEFCAMIAETMGVSPITTTIPYPLAYLAALAMETFWRITAKKTRPLLTTYTVRNLGSRLKFSIEKAERELEWKPKIAFRDGFRRTMEWLKTLETDTLKQK